jgi:hypothetical protein
MAARAATQPLTKAVDTQRSTSATYPTLYPEELTDELAADICAQIGTGRSLNSICKAEGMPSLRTVLRWLSDDSQFSEELRRRYAHARQQAADSLVDEICDIADNALEDPNSRRIRVDARKWVASRLKPREYGDIQRIEGNIEVTLNLADQLLEARRKRRNASALPSPGQITVDSSATAESD